MFENKKIVIFDMDGTLIDSVGMWNQVDQRLICALGGNALSTAELQEQRDRILRKFNKEVNPYWEYCNYMCEKYHATFSADKIFELRYKVAADFLVNTIDYKTGADRVVKKLKDAGLTLIIASTTRKANMDIYRTQNKNIMQKANLDHYFTKIFTKEDAKKIKPDPEIHFRILRELHVSPEECIIFEDSLVGMEAAQNADIDAAVIYDRYSDSEREQINRIADYRFDNYDELYKIVVKEFS